MQSKLTDFGAFTETRANVFDAYPRLVKYITPAQHDGISTGIFVASADPVRGVVNLGPGDERDTNLLRYGVRLSPSDDDRLAEAFNDIEL